MADDVHVNVPAGNNGGERVEVSLKDRALRFNTKDAVSMVIVLILGAAIYFMTHNVTANQLQGFLVMEKAVAQGNANQMALLEKMGAYQGALLEKMSAGQNALFELVHINRQKMTEDLVRQDDIVNKQTRELQQAVERNTEVIGQKIDALAQKLGIHDLNMRQPPGENLPLDLPANLMPGRPEGQR
jgi:hypothetical protein